MKVNAFTSGGGLLSADREMRRVNSVHNTRIEKLREHNDAGTLNSFIQSPRYVSLTERSSTNDARRRI